MKKILILGTGNAQEDIIRYCKDEGFEVYACSYTSGDNAEKYADHFSLINITAIDEIIKYVVDNKIDLVYSVGSDLAMPSVAAVSERLDMPHFVSLNAAHICNNKNLLREHLGKEFKGNLDYTVLSKVPEEIALEFPVVMKPVDSQGQRGVIKLNNMDELKRNFEHSLSFSQNKKVIIEEFVEGDEVSVNIFLENGEIKFALVSDREVWDGYPGGIIHKHILPSKYQGRQKKDILDLVDRVIKKIKINDGPVYFQIKMKNGTEPRLLEVTPRLDGCHMWRVIKEYTGVDLLATSVKMLLGEKMKVNFDKPILSNASLEFMCAEPGTEFMKERYNIEGARFIKYYYQDHQKVKRMNGYMEKCGYIIRGCE